MGCLDYSVDILNMSVFLLTKEEEMIIDGNAIAKKIKDKARNCCSDCYRKPNVVAFMLGVRIRLLNLIYG